MTSPLRPGRWDGNDFEPPSVHTSDESLNHNVAPTPAAPGTNPFTRPELFVRPPRPRSFKQRLADVLVRLGVLAFAAVLCVVSMWAFLNHEDRPGPPRRSAAGAPPAAPASRSPTPSLSPASPAPAAPSATANPLDAVQVRDCLRNKGTDADPDMVPTACGRGTYQVLRRLWGTTDPTPCRSVPGTTTYYTVTYYRNFVPDYGLSYVFCLKQL